MLTASTPASASARARSTRTSDCQPLGGNSSTLVTNSPAASFLPHRERSASGTGSTSAAAATSCLATTTEA